MQLSIRRVHEAVSKDGITPSQAFSNFDKMLSDIVRVLEADIQADPSGKNTKVEIFREATINKRKVTAVRITHPQKQDDLEFHLAVVYIDNEWEMPTRFEVYDWPSEPDGKPILLGEFTFLQLKINVDLPDSTFRVLVAPVSGDE